MYLMVSWSLANHRQFAVFQVSAHCKYFNNTNNNRADNSFTKLQDSGVFTILFY